MKSAAFSHFTALEEALESGLFAPRLMLVFAVARFMGADGVCIRRLRAYKDHVKHTMSWGAVVCFYARSPDGGEYYSEQIGF